MNENIMGIVKYIFSMFIEIDSYAAVTDNLNRKKVTLPFAYRKTGEVFFSSEQEEYKS